MARQGRIAIARTGALRRGGERERARKVVPGSAHGEW